MKKRALLHNKVKKLREAQGLSSAELAELIGTSRPHMSRLENGKSPLDADWILKIAGALDVQTSEVADVQFSKKFASVSDDALVGSVLGWLLEANDQYKTKLTNEELAKWSSFIFKKVAQKSYNYSYTRDLTFTIVEVIKQTKK